MPNPSSSAPLFTSPSQRGPLPRYFRAKRFLLERFLFGEMVRPTLIGIGGGTVLLTAGKLFELADQLVVDGVEPLAVFQLLLLDIPSTMVLAMPIAALFGTMLTLGKLSANSETTALRAVGISYRQLFFPLLCVGLVLSGIAYGINDGIVPLSRQRIRQLDRQTILTQTNPRSNRDVFFRTPDGLWFFIRQVDPQANRMQDVTILTMTPATLDRNQQILQSIVAREASWDGEQWLLAQGVVHSYDNRGVAIAEVPFLSRPLEVGEDLASLMQPEVSPQELTSQQLRQRIDTFSGSNLPTNDLRTEWHLRFSIPLASFFSVLISLPLAVQSSRQIGRYGGLVVAILLIFIYYVMLSLSRSLGEAGAVEPWLASWSHNMIFGGVGLLLLLRYLR